MLTLFSTPKPFRGHIGIIQRNALKSWTLLHPDVEVILFGDEEGAAAAAAELGLRHEPQVRRSPSGAKYLDYLFDRAQQIARHEFLCYANCDMVFTRELIWAVQAVREWQPDVTLGGRRWDVNVAAPLEFASAEWEIPLLAAARRSGVQKGADWIDYFVFPRGVFRELPPMVIGRVGWDNFLLWKARALKLPLVDASAVVTALHQNHDYAYHPQGQAGVWQDAEAQRNRELAGGRRHLFTLENATHRLARAGQQLRVMPNRWHWLVPAKRAARQAQTRLWFGVLGVTRPVRHALGLRRRVADPREAFRQ